jgi:putative copper resistance protein D
MYRRTIVSLALLPAALLAVLTAVPPSPARAQEGHDHSQMQHTTGAPSAPRKSAIELEADKRFSEFNHRFAGVFILLIGLLAVFEPRLAARFGWVRYLWSFLFFAPGVYLLIWSDPESWPTGSQSLAYVVTQNMQVLQHKVFSLILLGLGVVEWVRVRRTVPSVWLSAVFPTLAGLGALLLLFHPHASDVGMAMDAESHRAMLRIQQQHLGFAISGFGIAVSKAVSDVGRFRPRLMRNLFALCMVLLALLLITYSE